MNPYENAGGYTQPQPRHNAQHQQQHQHQQNQYQQQQQPSTQYTSNRYNPNAYQQPAQQNNNQYQQQQQQPRSHMTSPPPLQHPVPTHPPVQMRDPAPTPSPRMNYAQAQQQGQGQYQQNQYRPQQAGGGPQQRSSFERSSFDQQGGGFGGSPRNQFMSPQQQHQPLQHQHQQQQQQQQSGIPSFPFNLNDGTTQLGMQFGRSAVMAGQEYVEQNVRVKPRIYYLLMIFIHQGNQNNKEALANWLLHVERIYYIFCSHATYYLFFYYLSCKIAQ